MKIKLIIIISLIIVTVSFSFSHAYASEYRVEEGAVCGNGIIEQGEQCDDNNVNNGDGCNSSCAIESGYTCSGEPSVCEVISGGGGPGGGGPPMDVSPPEISSIEVVALNNSAAITWNTDEPSISWIIYGESINYGQELKTTEYVSSHYLEITNLLPETIYHYQVKSKDQNGNIGSFAGLTFTTLSGDEDLIAQLKLKIAQILAEIARLKALIVQLQGIEGLPVEFRFNRNLKQGDNLEDVQYLQVLLNLDADTQLNTQPGQWGSKGRESIHFGSLTKDAVIRFQEKYRQDILTPLGLFQATGFVGPSTRTKLNEILGK